MCGIAGVFHYAREGEVPESVLRSMADSITHRGPDENGIYRDGPVGFGFRRLSIVDLAAGHQPMATEDGRYCLVFNGEVYNHLEVRRRLEAAGHAFRTRCDTEVVLRSYAEYGAGCVDHLHGMFAFAVWDARERTLFVARDRVGIKPVYFAQTRGAFVFGSEIKALFRHPDLAPELERDELARYFTFLCLPAPQTLFRGIHKLAAGHTMLVDASGAREQRRYWNPIEGPVSDASEEDLAAEVRATLETAVQDRLMADVPYGAFLSGGIDSSSIVAIMSRIVDRPVETFTVGYKDDPSFNEFEVARGLARTFGTNHHEVLIDHEDFRSFLPKLIHHQDEPIADPVSVPLYFVSELARKNGVIVSLIGEGSDELFFGYTWHNRVRRMVERFWRPMSGLPGPLRSAATRAAEPFLDLPRRDFLRRLRQGGEPFWGGAVTFFPAELERLAPSLAGDTRREEIVRSIYTEFDALRPDASFATRAGYLELMYRLPELLLTRVDKMTMATSVEGRVPFLDHRMVELAFRIPGHLKVKNDVPKSILKKAVADLIPDEIIHRPKVGFHVPLTRWFTEVLSPMAADVLLDPRMRDLQIWDEDEVRGLLARQRAGRGNLGMRIWSLVNFALWYRYWILGEDVPS